MGRWSGQATNGGAGGGFAAGQGSPRIGGHGRSRQDMNLIRTGSGKPRAGESAVLTRSLPVTAAEGPLQSLLQLVSSPTIAFVSGCRGPRGKPRRFASAAEMDGNSRLRVARRPWLDSAWRAARFQGLPSWFALGSHEVASKVCVLPGHPNGHQMPPRNTPHVSSRRPPEPLRERKNDYDVGDRNWRLDNGPSLNSPTSGV